MAQIWFEDLEIYIQEIDYSQDIEIDFDKCKILINELYEKWEDKHPEVFKDFRPVNVIDGKIKLNGSNGWEDDKYLLPFVVQGGDFNSFDPSYSGKEIGWGREENFKNDIISSFTNDLVKLFGENAGINFAWQVTADDGYESYSVFITPNFENQFPNIDARATFYNEEEDEDDS